MPSKSRSVIPPQATIFHAPQRPFRVLGRFYNCQLFSTESMPKPSPRLQRSGADVRAALREQVTLLIAYCENFDSGQQAFCKPMATSVRILLHQTGKSESLLGQLKLRSGRFFQSPRQLVQRI